MQWVKLWVEFLSDPKVVSMPEVMQCRLVKLFLIAGRGDLHRLTDGEVAVALRISKRAAQKTRELFVSRGFILEDWTVRNFEARQAKWDRTAAERQRRKRDAVTLPDGPERDSRARGMDGDGMEKRREGEGARPPDVSLNGHPDPDEPGPPPDPAWVGVTRLASELTRDPGWSAWVRRMAALGFPPEWVADVLRKMAARGRLDEGYGHGILRRYREQGGPDRRPGAEPTHADVFDPAKFLARLRSCGWTLEAVGPDKVQPRPLANGSSPEWEGLSGELRAEHNRHKGELKAYVLQRVAGGG